MSSVCRILMSLWLMWVGTVTVSAQEESPSKRINSVKRTGQYIYAEATADTEVEALEGAKSLLLIQVSEYVASKKKYSDASQVIVRDLKAEQQSITMQRGTMIRAFLYVKKSDILPAETVETISREEVDQTVATQHAGNMTGSVENVLDNEPASSSVSVDFGRSSLADWQQNLLKNIAECKDIHRVKLALNKYKASYRVKRMGGQETPRNPQQSFFAFFDSAGLLKALVSREENGQRTDYLSGQDVSLADYASLSSIWFELSK